MTAAWVAGSVRARAIARRRVGHAGAREVAACPSTAAAVDVLMASPYGRELAPGSTLAGVQDAVAASVLWNMRVLAGWLPSDGVRALRALAGWFEIANVDQQMLGWAGVDVPPPFRLGMLATAWPRLAATDSLSQLRSALAASTWGDPGGDSVRDIQLGMRLAWAQRIRARVPAAADWARGGAVLLVARERFALGRPLPGGAEAAARRLLGAGAGSADSLSGLASTLPPSAAPALQDVERPTDLWRAEVRWWARLRTEGAALLAGAGFGPDRAVGAVAVLAGDAMLVRAALELAARGGTDQEAFDALA